MVRIARFILIGIRFIIPWVIRVVGFTARLVAMSVVSLWVGVPTAVRRIANQWVGNAVTAGFPTEYDSFLYRTLCVVAFLVILAGWIIGAFITVWLVHLIF